MHSRPHPPLALDRLWRDEAEPEPAMDNVGPGIDTPAPVSPARPVQAAFAMSPPRAWSPSHAWTDVLAGFRDQLGKVLNQPLVQEDPVCRRIVERMVGAADMAEIDALVDALADRLRDRGLTIAFPANHRVTSSFPSARPKRLRVTL